MRPDNDANERVYGKKVTADEIILNGAVPVPPSAQKMVSLLDRKSPKNLSDPNSTEIIPRPRSRNTNSLREAAFGPAHVCLKNVRIRARHKESALAKFRRGRIMIFCRT